MLIRRATQADLSVVWTISKLAIDAQCRTFYADELIDSWIAAGLPDTFASDVSNKVWIAELDGQIAGFGKINLDAGVVDAVFVHPACMSQGVGRQILAHLERQAHDSGLTRLNLNASLNAEKFYRSCGYEAGRLAKHLTPGGVELDCIPMSKKIA